MKKIMFMHKPEPVAYEIFKDYEIHYITLIDSRTSIIYKLIEMDIVVTDSTFDINADVLKRCKKVKLINNFGVGYNNFDLEKAKEYDIALCNCPSSNTLSTAEFTMAMLLALSRKVINAHKRTIESMCTNKQGLIGNDISFKKVGIIGAGMIGKKVASFLKAYEVSFMYYNRNKDAEFEKDYNAKYVSLEELYKESDIILIHCPLTKETKHLVDASAFKLMKPSVLLVNTARGAIVKTEALINALNNHTIAGAALDVYEEEPFIPSELFKRTDVVLSPHIADLTHQTLEKLYLSVKKNVDDFFNDKEPVGLLNK